MPNASPRPEYPRPQLRRQRWTNLNGEWSFAFDEGDKGLAVGWHQISAQRVRSGDSPFDKTIIVPFSYQTPASGIADSGLHRVLWYSRIFDAQDSFNTDERLLLHIGAADYRATVWVNGRRVADHEGGYTPFSADITDAVIGKDDVLIIRVEDVPDDLESPRGKQYWKERSEDVFYRGTSGIWQTVWLEPVSYIAVEELTITPDLDAANVELTVSVTEAAVGGTLRVVVEFEEAVLIDDSISIMGVDLERGWSLTEVAAMWDSTIIELQGIAAWSPEEPHLYALRLEVRDPEGALVDEVESYFGMRSIESRDGQVLLNKRPYYQRLVLDQGYFPEGGYTATSDEELRRDIELAKEMGFNGARKHQKVEDPRWLYWADRLGFLVWEEMPSGYRYSPRYVRRISTEWQDVIARDRNHPCIVIWVPMNESWGVPTLRSEPDPRQVSHLLAMYHLTRAIDATRLVVSNDGWEHALTDLCTVHDYGDDKALRARFSSREAAVDARPLDHPIYVKGHPHCGEPILVSEFGGVALEEDGETWGFHTVADGEVLLNRYSEFVASVVESEPVVGFCWTQLTDIEQEANGLLTINRVPKANTGKIRSATLQQNDPLH